MYGQAMVEAQSASVGFTANKSARWRGGVVSALVAAFLLFDAGIKVMMLEPAVEGSVQLGYPEGTVFGIGLALLVSTALYAVPRTAFLGAILLTGHLGGAAARAAPSPSARSSVPPWPCSCARPSTPSRARRS